MNRLYTCGIFGFEATTNRTVEADRPDLAACEFRRSYDLECSEWPEDRQVTVREHATGRVTYWVVSQHPEPVYEARGMKPSGKVK